MIDTSAAFLQCLRLRLEELRSTIPDSAELFPEGEPIGKSLGTIVAIALMQAEPEEHPKFLRHMPGHSALLAVQGVGWDERFAEVPGALCLCRHYVPALGPGQKFHA